MDPTRREELLAKLHGRMKKHQCTSRRSNGTQCPRLVSQSSCAVLGNNLCDSCYIINKMGNTSVIKVKKSTAFDATIDYVDAIRVVKKMAISKTEKAKLLQKLNEKYGVSP